MHLNEYDIECMNNAKDFIDADKGRHHTMLQSFCLIINIHHNKD
jgi:hypothetical protein